MRVYYYDAVDKLSIGNAVKMSSLEESSARGGRGNSTWTATDNTNPHGRRRFAMMKDSAHFINLSRGHVVNLDALHKHLVSGKIARPPVDVFPIEPAETKNIFFAVAKYAERSAHAAHWGSTKRSLTSGNLFPANWWST